jgi:hypothetical protein
MRACRGGTTGRGTTARRLGAALDGLFMAPKTMNVRAVPKGVLLQEDVARPT